jgi:hypothetical protein
MRTIMMHSYGTYAYTRTRERARARTAHEGGNGNAHCGPQHTQFAVHALRARRLLHA